MAGKIRQVRGKAKNDLTAPRVAELIIQGHTFQTAAQELGISTSAAYKRYKKIEKEWRETALQSLNEEKTKELRKLDRVEREAWKAWDRSIGEMEKIIEKNTGENPGTDIIRWTESGDPKYLQLILNCIAKRADLLGLNKMPEDWKPMQVVEVNIDEIRTELARVREERARLIEQLGES